MIRDAREISDAMREITDIELQQGLGYVVATYPLDVAVNGLEYFGNGNKLAVTFGSTALKAELCEIRAFIAQMIPESYERESWLKRYNGNAHVTLGVFDMTIPPSKKMIDEVREKLPATVTLDAPKFGYDTRHIKELMDSQS